MDQHKTVEEFIANHPDWQRELTLLRELMNATAMKETIKWGIPVYTINNKNVLGIGASKTYTGIWFFQGVFLSDPKEVLINAQTGKTKGMRQWRFKSFKELDTPLIKEYVNEAIAHQKAGKAIKPEKKALVITGELAEALSADVQLSKAFDMLNLTRKRAYVEYIAEAKREATKRTRMMKIKPMIVQGIGLNDKYR